MSKSIFNTGQRLYEAAQAALLVSGEQEDMSVYSVLSEIGDLDQLPGILGEPTDGNGLATMINSFELEHALYIAANEMGFYNSPTIIRDKVKHESQHAEAAEALGLIAVHAVRFKLLQNGGLGMKVTTIPSGGPVTKLGFAAAMVYPERLSSSDIRKAQSIGYAGVEDVAERIIATGADIPFPLSIQKP